MASSRLLNVGGGPTRVVPDCYSAYKQDLLDIDPSVNPDICADARELKSIEPNQYQAVYCSHNLEHYTKKDAKKVLAGFMHVLEPCGTVEIHVPNITELMRDMLSRNLDIEDVWYRAGNNPITYHDVLYGWSREVDRGNLFYSHKCGFTALSLYAILEESGFKNISIQIQGSNLMARASKE